MAPHSKRPKAKAASAGQGLAKFFNIGRQAAPSNSTNERVAENAAAHEPLPTDAAPTEALLTDQQLQRIDENKQRALERQRLKRIADGSSRDGVKIGSCSIAAGSSSTASLSSRAAPPAISRPAAAPAADRFAPIAIGDPWMQYNNLYGARLQKMRDRVLSESRALWRHQSTVLVGIISKEMPKRKTVVQLCKGFCPSNHSFEDVERSICSDFDILWLEDEGHGRVRLEASADHVASLVTGLICAVKGQWNAASHAFAVSALCFASSPPQPLLLPVATESVSAVPYVALVSGLHFGDASMNVAIRERCVDYLLAASKSIEGTLAVGFIQRLIVCGDSIATFQGGVNEEGNMKNINAALSEADACFDRLSAVIPAVDVMPGRKDLSNYSLPQEPLHPYLFKRIRANYSHRRNCFKSVRNPYAADFEGFSVLGTSGQPVQDILRCSRIPTALDALKLCLAASHIAPTAPDTLSVQPFKETDPFIIDSAPHLFFSGNHASAAYCWQEAKGAAAAPGSAGGTNAGHGGTQCVIVPAFHLDPSIVLVSMMDPRVVLIKSFGSK